MRALSLKWAYIPSKTPTPNLAALKISIFETTISSGSVKLHGRQLQNRSFQAARLTFSYSSFHIPP